MLNIIQPREKVSDKAGKFFVGLDHGTLSTKICLMDSEGEVLFVASKEHRVSSPIESHLQLDPNEITRNVLDLFEQLKSFVRSSKKLSLEDVSSMGITNQRETVVLWDAQTGQNLTDAILWSDCRTKEICQRFIKRYGGANAFKTKTGLNIATYFSLFKVIWALENVDEVRRANEKGDLRVSTMDSWIMMKLLNGEPHITEHSNASRTFVYNISKLDWDEELLLEFGLSRKMLPRLKNSCDDFGSLTVEGLEHVRVTAVLGDQQAASFGVGCVTSQDWNITFGTGTFLVKPTGSSLCFLPDFLTTVLYHDSLQTIYALEGSLESGGANLNFLQKNMNLYKDVNEISNRTANLPISEMLHHKYSIGTLNGIFAPLWNPNMKAMLVGLSQHDDDASIFCAVLEGIAYRIKDQIESAPEDMRHNCKFIFNGGLSKSLYLRRFCAQILGVPVESTVFADSTVLGITLLSSLERKDAKIDLSKIKGLIPQRTVTFPEHNPQATNAIQRKYKNYQKLRNFGIDFFEGLDSSS